jgi:hypothetical protein
MSLVLWFAICFGASMILGHSKITRPIREYLPEIVTDALGCVQCTGFWIGLILSAQLYSPTIGLLSPLSLPGWMANVLDAIAASGVNLLLYGVIAAMNGFHMLMAQSVSTLQNLKPAESKPEEPCCEDEKDEPPTV